MKETTFRLSELAVADINHNIRNPLTVIAGKIVNYGDNELVKEIDEQVARITSYLKTLKHGEDIKSVYANLVHLDEE